MKGWLKDRERNLCAAVMAGILCLGVAGGCASGDDINGSYEYEETIYLIPLSSFITTKDNADEYIITEDALTIVHPDGSEERIAAGFDKSEVTQEAFTALFRPAIGVPDISVFKQRHQYSINEQYHLYTMDDEVWLARCPGGTMWGIYRLVKTGSG